MGTLNFTVGKYATGRGSGAGSTRSSDVITSGAYTTSTSASFVEDSGGDIEVGVGHVFMATPKQDMWVIDGGNTAAVGTGHFMQANVPFDMEIATAGKISVIDVP